jgi:hypothetical protein
LKKEHHLLLFNKTIHLDIKLIDLELSDVDQFFAGLMFATVGV